MRSMAVGCGHDPTTRGRGSVALGDAAGVLGTGALIKRSARSSGVGGATEQRRLWWRAARDWAAWLAAMAMPQMVGAMGAPRRAMPLVFWAMVFFLFIFF